ncbi:MAG: NADPH-dependent FMN reductase [Sphingomonadaceae bacterium]
MSQPKPLIVGIGGSGSATGTTERVLRLALDAAEAAGAETQFFDGKALDMPMYRWGGERTVQASALIEALRRADGVVIASPGYHGTVSGLIKNALDYVEDMAKDDRVYFEGRAVGLIAVAAGWQATGSTLATLRSITHALRGWPTPMAIAINSAQPVFADDGTIRDGALNTQLMILAGQVVEFARMKSLDLLSRAASQAQAEA